MKSSITLAVLNSLIISVSCSVANVPTVDTTSGLLMGVEQDGGEKRINYGDFVYLADPQKSSHSRELYGHFHFRVSYILSILFFFCS